MRDGVSASCVALPHGPWLQLIDFLAERPFFTADYLDHLRRKPLDASLLKVFERDGRINVRVEGPWQDVILWEIPVLAIISEMRNRFRYPQFGVSQALARLDQKLDKLERELLDS